MKKRLICLCLFLGATVVVYGQDMRDTVALPAVNVTASKASIPASFKTVAFDSVTLATNELFALSDLLGHNTPVYIKEYGVGGLASLALRGTAAKHTQLYWNGIALNSPMLGQADLALFPLAFLDQAELHAGAGSVMDGSGGLGGSLQLANVPDWKEGWKLQMQGQAGSFNTYLQQGRLTWGNRKWQFHSTVYHRSAENDFTYRDYHRENRKLRRKNAELRQQGVMQEVYHKLDKKNSISVRAWWYESDRNLPGILGTEAGSERQYDRSWRSMAEWENQGKKHLLEMKLAWLSDELNYQDDSLGLSSESQTLSAQFYGKYTYYLDDRFKLLSQLQLRQDEAHAESYEGVKYQRSASLLTGGTWQSKGRRFSVDLYSRQEMVDEKDFYWIPTLGCNYRLFREKSWLVKGSASLNVRYPTLNDLYWEQVGNEALKAEQSRSLEAGIHNDRISGSGAGNLSFEWTVFYAHVDNWILWQPAGNMWKPGNLRKVENKGMETMFKYRLGRGRSLWHFSLSHAYTATVNLANAGKVEHTAGKQLIYVPENKFQAMLSWKWKEWYCWYRQSYTDPVYIDAVNERYLPGFTLADAAIGRRIGMKDSKLELGFAVHNLYGVNYQVIAERPMPGRYCTATVKYTINKTK